ncbi:MAG: TnsA endonuclease N-terminal domain-containing protein [Pirellulaceae bacterium]|tara:strand:- start:23878 stop:24312 length:435 start_codon:yes stop_codon:yes gene_type:complete
MSYTGKYRPSNRQKYKGDPTQIIYRSLWERKFMQWCDKNENVLEWGSEEIIIPYISPVDNRVHRYFPDFYIRARTRNDGIKKFVIEVKPKAQCSPPKPQRRKTRKFLNEVKTYAVNDAKWKAAQDYCKDRRMTFMILTEKELKV